MASPYATNIRLGTAAASHPALASERGKTVEIDGVKYRLVQVSGTAITGAAGKTLATGVTAGRPTFVASQTTAADDVNVVGVVPEGQIGSTGTVDLQIGDYLWVVVNGYARVRCAAGVVAGDLISSSSTAGSAGATLAASATTFDANTFRGVIGTAMEAVGATVANFAMTRINLV